MAYYITDRLWGILDEHHLTVALYADTTVHFAAMAMAVMLWTRYVIDYLEGKRIMEDEKEEYRQELEKRSKGKSSKPAGK